MSELINNDMIAFISCAAAAVGANEANTKSNPVFLKAGSSTCEEAVEGRFARGECKYGCVGGGDCIKSCKAGAIVFSEGRIIIDKEKCDGCGDCAKEGVCVQGLISMIPSDATNFIPCSNCDEDEYHIRELCGYGCVGCGDCHRVCPNDAVSIVDNHAEINYVKCEGCEACAAKCRKKIIVDNIHSLVELKEKMAFVKCSGDFSNREIFKGLGYKTCREAAENADFDDERICESGCLGQGDCARACRFDAIHVENGCAVVDMEKCVGCRDCSFVCPKGIIEIVPFKGARIVPCSSKSKATFLSENCVNSCTGCGDCEANCPNGAIYMKDGRAVVDSNYCENCHICEYVCQKNIIKRISVPEEIYLQNRALDIEKR